MRHVIVNSGWQGNLGAAGTGGSKPGEWSDARDDGTDNVEAEEERRCLSPATQKEISR